MDDTPVYPLTFLASYAVLAAVLGGVAVWLAVLRRVLHRRPVISFEPRRPVPWNGLDIIAILLAYLLIGGTLALTAYELFDVSFDKHEGVATGEKEVDVAESSTSVEAAEDGAPAPEEEAENGDDTDEVIDLDRAHPVVVLLSGDSSLGTILLCVFAVVILAPVAEEFFFRLLLQGYFERIEWRARRVWRYTGQLFGLAPVLLSSLLFAALHARQPEDPLPARQLIVLFSIDSFTKVVLVTGAVTYLMKLRGTSWEDLGIRLDTLRQDFKLAIASYVAVIVPIYFLQEGLSRLFPDMVPDPLPLFLLALALGYLYFRTHRVTPAVLLHLLFNGTALVMFFALSRTPPGGA